MTVSRRQIEPVVGHSTPFHSVPARWVVVAFKRLAKLKYGDSLVDVREQRTGEFPIYGSNGLLDWCDRYNASAPCIVVGRKGSAGRINWVDSPCYVSDTALYIDEPSPKVLLRWLYYVLMPMRLETRSEDSAVPGLARELVESQSVPLPPLKEQREIVRFLDKETARIDLLLERKRELVAALSDRYETAIELAYIDDARHRRLKDVCQLIQCGPFGSQLGFGDYIMGGIPVINPQDLAAEGIRGNPGTTIDEATFQRLRRHAVRDGDLVLARRGQMGNAGLVGNEHKGWLCGTGSMLIRGRMSVVRPEFLHMVITSPFSRCWLEGNSVGTTMSNLSAGIVGRLPVPVPPLDEQDGMIGLVTEVRAESAALLDSVGSSIDRLREYRSALIAAVVTGQTDVGSAA